MQGIDYGAITLVTIGMKRTKPSQNGLAGLLSEASKRVPIGVSAIAQLGLSFLERLLPFQQIPLGPQLSDQCSVLPYLRALRRE